MRTIEEIANNIKQICDEMLDSEKSMNKNNYEIDLEKIEAIATKNPLIGHKVCELDEHIQRIYLKYLVNIINLTNNQNTRYSQILFLNRIIKDIKNTSINIKDIILTSLNQTLDLDEFIKCISDDIVDLFVVDSLIISNITGNIERESLDYISEIISLFNIKNDKFCDLVNLAKSILERNDDKIEEYSIKCSDLSLFLCYMENPYDGVFVYTLEQAKNYKVEKIILYNCHIKNKTESINLDEFYADEITFINCKFENIQGIYSINKKIIFKSCDFFNINSSEATMNQNKCYIRDNIEDIELRHETQIVLRKGFIIINNCLFYNCKFRDCTVSQNFINGCFCKIIKCYFDNCKLNKSEQGEYLIVINNGNFKDSVINNCNIKTNEKFRRTTIAGIVVIINGKINNCKFKNCSTYLSTSLIQSYYNSYILHIRHSTCMDCKFEKCYCNQKRHKYFSSENYIIGMYNSNEKNNYFIECESKNYRYEETENETLVGNIE